MRKVGKVWSFQLTDSQSTKLLAFVFPLGLALSIPCFINTEHLVSVFMNSFVELSRERVITYHS